MICEYPAKYEGKFISCGRCAACRKRRADEWVCRVLCEPEALAIGGYGVTLTYNDETCPECLSKAEVSRFIKRVRDRLGYPKQMKYIGVGEYGSKRGRPHYHVLIIGIPINDDVERALAEAWTENKKGSFVCIKPIGHGREVIASVRYTCGYLCKTGGKYEMKPRESVAQYAERTGKKTPQFFVASTKLGLAFFEKNERAIVAANCIRRFGERFMVPRYYRKKIEQRQTQKELEDDLRRIRRECVGRLPKDQGLVVRWHAMKIDVSRVAHELYWFRRLSRIVARCKREYERDVRQRWSDFYAERYDRALEPLMRRYRRYVNYDVRMEDARSGYSLHSDNEVEVRARGAVERMLDEWVEQCADGRDLSERQYAGIKRRCVWHCVQYELEKELDVYRKIPSLMDRVYASLSDLEWRQACHYSRWNHWHYLLNVLRMDGSHNQGLRDWLELQGVAQWNEFMCAYKDFMLEETVQRAINLRESLKFGKKRFKI